MQKKGNSLNYTLVKTSYLKLEKLLVPYFKLKLKIFPICHIFHLLFPI